METYGPDAGDRLVEAVADACDQIARLPSMGRERDSLEPGVRSLPLRRHPFVIYYREEPDGVEIMRILSAPQRGARAPTQALTGTTTLNQTRELTPTSAAVRFRGEDEGPHQERQMSFPIPPEFERAVLDRVRSGRYASAEDVLHACLAALEQAEEEVEALRRELRIAEEEVERGQVIDGAEAIAQARAEFRKHMTGMRMTLPPELQRFVEDQVRIGRFASPLDVLEAAVLLLQEEEESLAAIEEFDRELRVGLEASARGEVIPAERAHELIRRWREEDLV